MKLRKATFEGFRGAPLRLDLPLAGKSLCLLGENGHGKTTIVDGLELWSSGDVQHYHREGYRLDCMVNVDAEAAIVRCETTSHPPLVRTLSGDTVSPLQPEGPMAVGATLPPELPVLRHRTMADFMDKSPGDKKKILLELFGLESLASFRRRFGPEGRRPSGSVTMPLALSLGKPGHWISFGVADRRWPSLRSYDERLT